ncbi:MAG: Ig-like domain-containing protein [Prevotella sp.]|nr:Ig-like domain-containing protein [Prevotella sp.]
MRNFTKTILLALLVMLGEANAMALESYDFQELCMKIGKGGPWAVNDGGDAGFTIGDATMHYLGDYTTEGFAWNGRFAYEYVEDRGKFTFRNKNNKKDSNCGLFSWDYDHYFSILGLKDGDKVTITIGTGTVTFASETAEGVSEGDNVVSNTSYTISTTDASTRLDIKMAKASLIAKIVIEPYGVESVPAITLDKTSLKLIPGATAKLTATVDPSGVVTSWKSDNESVATVASDGTVTAVAAGTAHISNNWASAISDATASATCEVTVADVDLSQYTVVRDYDFTTMGDVTLELQTEAAGAIWNEANSKANDVFFCTNKGLEEIAVQAAVASNKGWSIASGQGLLLASGAGRCAAVGGIKAGQIVEFIYTGDAFYTRSDDDGIEKTALNEGTGRAIYQADEDGMLGFELIKGNAVQQINIYEKAEADNGYKFVATEWIAGDAGRISPDKVTVNADNTISVSQTGQNNVALIFRSSNVYEVKAAERYFVIKGTGLSTAAGASYLWWLNNTNNGSQIEPTDIYEEDGQTVMAWDCATIAIGGQLGLQDTEFKDEGGWSTTFGLTLQDEAVAAVISYIGFREATVNPVEEYEYEFVASEWPAGDPGRISASQVVVDEAANTITVSQTGDNNVALNFKTDKTYYLPEPVKYFVIQATGLSEADGKSYLWWLNAKNNGGQIAPTTILSGDVTTFMWDITADATFASGFSTEGKTYLDGNGASTWGWTTTFGLTLKDASVPAVISYIGYETEESPLVTAVSGISRPTVSSEALYNLQGQRVVSARKGLYIQGGKIFIVK